MPIKPVFQLFLGSALLKLWKGRQALSGRRDEWCLRESCAVGWNAAVGWTVWCDGGGCAVHECDDGGGFDESGGHCSLAYWEPVAVEAVEVRQLAAVEVAAVVGVALVWILWSGCRGSRRWWQLCRVCGRSLVRTRVVRLD